MDLKQLASLKEELARQAASKNKAQDRKLDADNPVKTPPVDPVLRTIGLLQKRFPLAFPKKPHPKVPLKIGIHKELINQAESLGITAKEIRAALRKWCKGKRYSECMMAGAARVDLQGKEAGHVTKEEAYQAENREALIQHAPTA
ncbi:ProQ/FinO family protein [Methylomonas sp. MgM2]